MSLGTEKNKSPHLNVVELFEIHNVEHRDKGMHFSKEFISLNGADGFNCHFKWKIYLYLNPF